MYEYKVKKTFKIKPVFYVVFFAMLLVAGSAFALRGLGFLKQPPAVEAGKLPIMKAEELKAFNGSRAGKPIYLGFEGLVYDVSAGKEYYQPGGAYHYLAGRDSTADLRIAGGDIIKRKYPVIARLAE